MKVLATILFLIFAIVPAIANNAGSKSEGAGNCSAPAHAHQYSDIRVAPVEVSSVDPCGFGFVNLEDNTVGLDHTFKFAPEFELVRIDKKDQKTSSFRKVGLKKEHVKKGVRGIAIYCSACNTVLSLSELDDQDESTRIAGK